MPNQPPTIPSANVTLPVRGPGPVALPTAEVT